jgi:hypothetical protein
MVVDGALHAPNPPFIRGTDSYRVDWIILNKTIMGDPVGLR